MGKSFLSLFGFPKKPRKTKNTRDTKTIAAVKRAPLSGPSFNREPIPVAVRLKRDRCESSSESEKESTKRPAYKSSRPEVKTPVKIASNVNRNVGRTKRDQLIQEYRGNDIYSVPTPSKDRPKKSKVTPVGNGATYNVKKQTKAPPSVVKQRNQVTANVERGKFKNDASEQIFNNDLLKKYNNLYKNDTHKITPKTLTYKSSDNNYDDVFKVPLPVENKKFERNFTYKKEINEIDVKNEFDPNKYLQGNTKKCLKIVHLITTDNSKNISKSHTDLHYMDDYIKYSEPQNVALRNKRYSNRPKSDNVVYSKNKLISEDSEPDFGINYNNNIIEAPVATYFTVVDSSNVNLKRGQGQGGGGSKGALRGASSVSSLDSKNPPPQTQLKTGSRDRVDRIGLIPPAKSERMKVSKNNNNKNEAKNILNGDTRSNDLTGPVSLPSTLEVCADPSEELVSVQQQLELIAEEKLSLVLRLDAQQEELQQLKSEMARLQEQHTLEVDHLHEENASLRARLKDVAHSPLSDTEKQLLLDSHRLHTSSSAPASFAHNEQSEHVNGPNEMSMSGANGIDGIPSSCPTPDWDKHSSSSMSEVSVACLQDRILQMEETHYSTNEELQATLQELADLQSQLLELQADNECLAREKDLLLESLCQQTEKLKDSRSTIDTLQELLIREQPETSAHREQKLVDLLKTAQEEKDTLLIKNEELNAEVHVLRQTTNTAHAEREQLADRVKLLESTLDSVHAEQKLLDEQLAQAKQQSSARRIEINRLGTLLDNARSKIDELEKERTSQGDRSEVDALLDTARQEKDKLESQVATLQGQVSKGHCEKERLEEKLSTLQEECKVTKNNAKSVISDLEYQLSEATREVGVLRNELQTVRNALAEIQTQAQHHLEDKRALKALLAETQRNLTDEQRLRKEENEEWDQFKRDLLTTVRVANDFKTEAQTELEKFVLENKSLRERMRALETELDKLKEATNPSSTISDSIPIPLLRQSSAPVLNSVQEMAARRQQRQENTLSVKSLIESIENATKQVKGGPGDSRSSSNSSLNSIVSNAVRSPTSPMPDTKSPLREQQQHTVSRTQRSPSSKNIITDLGYNGKGGVVDGKSEDTIRESVAILSGKNIDFVRRNSYGDLSERKDPLNSLVKNGGSKRNALLKWCQQKTVGYRNIDITNFSSSWNDGLALCALLHTYLPERVPYDTLVPSDKRRNFSLAFAAAESVGIQTTLNINDMCQLERPDWQQVMAYVTAIYKHFET